jgi:2Fe-2S ferredoxin
MTHVTFIDHTGVARTVEAPAGMTIADAALGNRIPGIEGDCGGFCACATCHVYLDDEWFDRAPPPDELETGMLRTEALDPRASSRLSCQLRLTDALDGIVVHTPARQYL